MTRQRKQQPGQENPKPHAKAEGPKTHVKSFLLSERLTLIKVFEVGSGISLAIALYFLTTSHKTLAVWLLFIALSSGVSVIYLTWLPSLRRQRVKKQRRIRAIFVAIEACVLLACITLQALVGVKEDLGKSMPVTRELRGFLIPANEPSPPAPPSCFGEVPDSATAFYFGDSMSYTTGGDIKDIGVLMIGQEKVLSFESASGGVLLNAVVRDTDGKEVARITKNVFHTWSGSGYEAQAPDLHSILVLDNKDQAVLYVRYLNPKAIKVMGVFYSKAGKGVVINESGVTALAQRTTINGLCSGNGAGVFRVD